MTSQPQPKSWIASIHAYVPGKSLGDDGRPLLAGPGVPTMADLRRGRFVAVEALGDDLRLALVLDDG
jgi:riboflavin biosynthesis pyrimidine reductase